MNLTGRLSRLVQTEIEAYFLFRDRLDDESSSAAKPENGTNPLSFSVVDRTNSPPQALDALAGLMAHAGLVTGDTARARLLVERRLAKGDACAVAWDRDKAVGLAWIAGKKSDVHDRFAHCARRIPGAVVLYQAYVDRTYRGRQLHLQLDLRRKDYLRASGIRQTLTFVGVRNFASVRNSMRGNDSYKLIYHLAVKGPKGVACNFYPKWAANPWIPCREELPDAGQGSRTSHDREH